MAKIFAMSAVHIKPSVSEQTGLLTASMKAELASRKRNLNLQHRDVGVLSGGVGIRRGDTVTLLINKGVSIF